MDTTIEKMNFLKGKKLKLIEKSLEPSDFEKWQNDTELYYHSLNTMFLSLALGKRVGLGKEDLEVLCLAALLHDIGKLQLALDWKVDRPLNHGEWCDLKNHGSLGSAMLINLPDLKHIAPYVTFHHENYDGGGYPSGIKSEMLPVEIRIISIADSFDAMIFKRTYQPVPRSIKEATEELRSCAGTQFDPGLVDVFVDLVNGNTFSIVRGLMLGGEPQAYDKKVTGGSSV